MGEAAALPTGGPEEKDPSPGLSNALEALGQQQGQSDGLMERLLGLRRQQSELAQEAADPPLTPTPTKARCQMCC